jgi:WD40 repeat protein
MKIFYKIESVDFFDYGTKIVSNSDDGFVKLWDNDLNFIKEIDISGTWVI